MNHSKACICAWCLKDNGIAPDEKDSHGICKTHADAMHAQAVERRVAREESRQREAQQHVHHHR